MSQALVNTFSLGKLKRHPVAKSLSLSALVLSGYLLMILHSPVGWAVWAVGLLLLLLAEQTFTKHMLLIFGSVAVLGLTPINTDIAFVHAATMGLALSLTVLVPYAVMRYVYKDEETIKYTWLHGKWHWWHFGYIALTALLGYLLLPFWMQSTGHYVNWTVVNTPSQLTQLFIGTNSLGIWDELFFVITTLAILRRHMPFWLANTIQATLWTIFLYELGFQGWVFPIIFVFALLQGLVFTRTHSLLYLLAIHLTLDFVLYLALVNAHYPELLNFFVTR